MWSSHKLSIRACKERGKRLIYVAFIGRAMGWKCKGIENAIVSHFGVTIEEA